MAEIGARAPSEAAAERPTRAIPASIVVVAWRNLWRNHRRTWLTAGGVAFAVLLVVAAMSLQTGSYAAMIDSGTGFVTGHVQLQHPDYLDNPRVRSTLKEATALVRSAEGLPGVVAVAPRAETFALVSKGERSYAAMVMGVDPERERAVSKLPTLVAEGRYLEAAADAVLGRALANNLDVAVGDELLVLGTAKEGGVAALAYTVVGIFDSGQAELDRSIVQVGLRSVQSGFELGDELHRVVITGATPEASRDIARAARAALPVDVAVLRWNALMPELEQAIQLDRLSAQLFYWIIMILVALSVVNTFIMTIFERTREFGMLLALGMRPSGIMLMLEVEALGIWAVGTALGCALAIALVTVLASVGIPLEGMEEIAAQYQMPDRLYPALDAKALVTSPTVMLFGTLLAAFFPALRVRRLAPVAALRGDE